MRDQLNSLRDFLSTLPFTDGNEELQRLLNSLNGSLRNPSRTRFQSIQTYVHVLKNIIQSNEEDEYQRGGSKTEMRLRRLWSFSLLDLATRFNVELDGVDSNLVGQMMIKVPKHPYLVCYNRRMNI